MPYEPGGMAHARVTVTTSPTLLADCSRPAGPRSLLIRNTSDGAIYLGGAGVVSTDGFEVAKKEILTIEVVGQLYAATASGTAIVHVLYRP